MSVRQDTSTEGLTRTSALPSSTAFTIAGWFRKRGVGDNSWEHVAGLLSSGGGNWMVLYARVAGTNNCVIHGASGDSSLAFSMVTGTWYYVAIGCNGTGSGALTGWVITEGGTVYTASTFGFSMTPVEMSLLKSAGYGEWVNGAFANVKVWNVKLTTAELLTQRSSLATVVQTGNIHLSSELRYHTDLSDNSGNNKPWTSMGGTLSSEEDPPGLYSSGTTYIQTASGVLVPTGVIIRKSAKRTNGSLGSSGLLRRLASKGTSGVLQSSSVVSKKTQKQNSGTLGLSGLLSKSMVKLVALFGNIGFTGDLSKKSIKSILGSINFFGSIERLNLYIRSLAGSLTFSGTISKSTTKTLIGQLISSSTLSRFITKSLSSSFTMVGELSRKTFKYFIGTLSFFGNTVVSRIVNTYTVVVSGVMSFAGTTTKSIKKKLSGSLSPYGSLVIEAIKQTRVVILEGYMVFAGHIQKKTQKSTSGLLLFSGVINRSIKKLVFGFFNFLGVLLRNAVSTPTPESRIYSITREDRTCLVDYETRYYLIGEDLR